MQRPGYPRDCKGKLIHQPSCEDSGPCRRRCRRRRCCGFSWRRRRRSPSLLLSEGTTWSWRGGRSRVGGRRRTCFRKRSRSSCMSNLWSLVDILSSRGPTRVFGSWSACQGVCRRQRRCSKKSFLAATSGKWIPQPGCRLWKPPMPSGAL